MEWPVMLNLGEWARGQYPGLRIERVFWRGSLAYYIPEGMVIKSVTDLEHEAGAALAAWDALTKNDPKGRTPQRWIADGEAYLRQHPEDAETRRRLVEFKHREAAAWSAFEAALSALYA